MSTRKYLTQQEISRLLAACHLSRHPERNSCLIYMCFIHGLRASEALSLKLSDLNLESNELYVHRLKNGFSVNHPLIDEDLLCRTSFVSEMTLRIKERKRRSR
ncbi:tyrosine-type recombinase/integrase [Providencia rettgeri]